MFWIWYEPGIIDRLVYPDILENHILVKENQERAVSQGEKSKPKLIP